MRLEVAVEVDAPVAEVWRIASDIENAERTISGIDKIEVLEPPSGEGILGLKWRETRTMFGKTATEIMWITEAGDSYYVTEARSHGSEYTTRVHAAPAGDGTRLAMVFEARPLTTGARVASALLGFMMKGAVRKALLKDLTDVKSAAEAAHRRAPAT